MRSIRRAFDRVFALDCGLCGRSFAGSLCDDCRKFLLRSPSRLSYELGVFACFDYSFPYNNIIRDAKEKQKNLSYSVVLEMFLEKAKLAVDNNVLELGEVLVPTPMHSSDYFRRKFDHSRQLAEVVSHSFLVPIVESVEKIKPTSKQLGSSRQERLEKYRKDIFEVKMWQNLPSDIKSLTIIDDVYTTGATSSAIREALLRINPRLSINVLVFASGNKNLPMKTMVD